jgi:hypothetical protein
VHKGKYYGDAGKDYPQPQPQPYPQHQPGMLPAVPGSGASRCFITNRTLRCTQSAPLSSFTFNLEYARVNGCNVACIVNIV